MCRERRVGCAGGTQRRALYRRHALRGRPCLLIEVAAGAVHLAGLERALVRRAVGEGVGAVPGVLVGRKLTLSRGRAVA